MNITCRYVILRGLLVMSLTSWPVIAGQSTDPLESAVALLDSGDIPAAEGLLKAAAKEASNNGNILEEAVARKWLGVALARSGMARMDEATRELQTSVTLLAPLAGKGNRETDAQMGFVLFDLAEALRTRAEMQLREQRMSGMDPAVYFTLVRDCVAPAETAIEKALVFYPSERISDLEHARGELALLLARLKVTFISSDDATAGYQQAIDLFRSAMRTEQSKTDAARNDVIISAAIRVVEIKRELATLGKDSKARQAAATAAIEELDSVERYATDHKEGGGYLLYLKALCMMEAAGKSIPTETAKLIEADLLKAADLVETMRSKLAAKPVFEKSSSFFSTRTHVYEALCKLYALNNQPENMLASIERMKARALRDILPAFTAQELDVLVLKQRLRQDNAGLVEFFLGPECAWAIWVSPGASTEILELPIDGQTLMGEMRKTGKEFAKSRDRRAWMRMVTGTMRASELNTMKEGFQSANRLYKLLLKPVVERASAEGLKRLYVVPHHAMNYLSLYSLVTDINETNLLASQFYVESGLPITCLPSASLISHIRSDMDVNHGTNAVFSRSDFRSIKPTYPADLEGTIPESKMVVEIASAKAFSDAEATEAKLRELKGPLELLYFATHGVLDVGRPLDSYILLAATDMENSSLDGRLTVGELMQDLRGALQANLVVLSACHTNEGETSPASGDDLTALSRGFMVAGARSVLATQWEASDATFPAIMRHFLTAWIEQKRPKDEALAFALRQFLATNDFPVWRHPHFWGPVILLGEAR